MLFRSRAPENFVRPKEKVFDMEWRQKNSTKEEIRQGLDLVKTNRIQVPNENGLNVLTSCSTCHR